MQHRQINLARHLHTTPDQRLNLSLDPQMNHGGERRVNEESAS